MSSESTIRRYLASRHSFPSELIDRVTLKFRILAEGLRISNEASVQLGMGEENGLVRPLRTRSGVSGGLDLVLAPNLFVNAPVRERFASESRLELGWDDGFCIVDEDRSYIVSVTRAPAFYGRMTSDGATPLERIGQMCSPDRLCFGITGPGCSFWAKDKRCKYCSIGYNYNADASRKTQRQFADVLKAAVDDEATPARHVLLGGGTPIGEDMGARVCADLTRSVKAFRNDIPVYVMIAAPLNDKYIDELYEAGVDELGFNLEFWADDSWERFIPGKSRVIGKARYLQALEYAAQRFGPVRTRSILICGLESSAETLRGIEELCTRGVMPILSPFRPLDGTLLASERGFKSQTYEQLFADAATIADRYSLPIGPTCAPCQNNTLAVPTAWSTTS